MCHALKNRRVDVKKVRSCSSKKASNCHICGPNNMHSSDAYTGHFNDQI